MHHRCDIPAGLINVALLPAVSHSVCSTVPCADEELQNAGSVLKTESRKTATGPRCAGASEHYVYDNVCLGTDLPSRAMSARKGPTAAEDAGQRASLQVDPFGEAQCIFDVHAK